MSRRVVTASQLLRGDSSTSSEDSNSEEESSPNLSPQDQAAIDSLDEVRPAFPVQSTVPRIEFDSSIMPAFFLPQNYRVTKGKRNGAPILSLLHLEQWLIEIIGTALCSFNQVIS